MARSYDRNFKLMAVKLVCDNLQSTSQVASDLDVPLKTFENWITAYHKDPHVFDPDYVSPEEENRRLKKIIHEQEQTIDILKKAAAFFAKDQT